MTTTQIRLSNDHPCTVTAEDDCPAEAQDGTVLSHAEQWDADQAIAEVRQQRDEERRELWQEMREER